MSDYWGNLTVLRFTFSAKFDVEVQGIPMAGVSNPGLIRPMTQVSIWRD